VEKNGNGTWLWRAAVGVALTLLGFFAQTSWTKLDTRVDALEKAWTAHEARLAVIETQRGSDHSTLQEVRQDVREIRSLLERRRQ